MTMDTYDVYVSLLKNHVAARNKKFSESHLTGARLVGNSEIKNPLKWYIENLIEDPKGLIIIGPHGVGKTTLMYCLSKIFTIYVEPFPTLFRAFQNKEIPVSRYYRNLRTRTAFSNSTGDDTTLTIYQCWDCFDDVGSLDEKIVDFGNAINPFQEIILNRYIHFERTGEILRTFVTSNLNDEGFIKNYGLQTWDRLREMCHVIVLDGESLRG